MKAVIGWDTSCYTTSVAAVSLEGHVLASVRRLLSVKTGDRGLRQSEGVFQHTQNLPQLLRKLREDLPDIEPVALCASAAPREQEGSYMPVFTVGIGAAEQAAALMGLPLYFTNHQSGHVAAARIGTDMPTGAHLALHLSGGTTEVLCADQNGALTLLGGSEDLHAGQFVDRVGVMLGLSFPAGPHLEALAQDVQALSLIAATCKGLSCSFSGAEAQAKRLYESGACTREQLAAEIYSCLVRTVEKLIKNASEETKLTRVLLAGGVVSSARFRDELCMRVHKRRDGLQLYFAAPEYSGDNAVGVAMIGLARYKNDKTRSGNPDECTEY